MLNFLTCYALICLVGVLVGATHMWLLHDYHRVHVKNHLSSATPQFTQ